MVKAEKFQGPLPHPDTLARYDEIVPGSAEWIVKRFLEQGEHRMQLEKMVIENDIKQSRWGLAAGFILALVVVLGAIYAIVQGYDFAGVAAIVSALATLAGVFVYGTKSRRDEREEKSKQ